MWSGFVSVVCMRVRVCVNVCVCVCAHVKCCRDVRLV